MVSGGEKMVSQPDDEKMISQPDDEKMMSQPDHGKMATQSSRGERANAVKSEEYERQIPQGAEPGDSGTDQICGA